MEIKINKEIRNYTESIYFGLSPRQFIFSLCACIAAVITYFVLKPYFTIEILSWICICVVLPFAVLGFVKYNGMYAEDFIKTWLKTEVLMPSVLLFKGGNYYFNMLEQVFENIKKKGIKEDEIFRKQTKKRKRQNASSKKCTRCNTNKRFIQ